MKHLPFATVALPLLFWTSLAVAQPPKAPALPAPKAEVRNPIVLPGQDISLSLHWDYVDVIELLQAISFQGNVEIIVHKDVSGKIKINLDKVAPELAIERVAQIAGLDWKLENKTYIISKKAPEAPPGKKDRRVTLRFTDVSVPMLLKMIAKECNVQVDVSDDVTETLQLIRLNNETPESAIEKIAFAANLVWRKDDNNNYFITGPQPDR